MFHSVLNPRPRPRMILMHDAPLISPENKDSGAEIFVGLPKVTLFAPLPTDASTPEELRAATHAVVQALADDHVVYAELRLRPSVFPFDAAEALAAVQEGLDVPGICLLYTSPSPRDRTRSRMPSSA